MRNPRLQQGEIRSTGRIRSQEDSLFVQLQAQVSTFPVRRAAKTYCVYRATAPNGKVYVGVTGRTLDARKIEHHYLARKGKNRHFAAALRKYGGSMVWEVLEEGISTMDEANERERHYIARYQSSDRSYGYNLTEGGDGVVASADTREKMSASAKARGVSKKQLANLEKGRGGFWKGRKHSAEARKRMSSAHTGRVVSDETRQKMSTARKGRKKSEEHKRKIKLANAHPLLRSDGIAFLSGRDADAALGLGDKGDYALKSVRRGGLCCGFTFQRISLEEYWKIEKAGKAWDGTIPSEPHPMAHRGWKWSEEQRAKLMPSRKRPRSENHERNRLAAISKTVYCSDGREFSSILDAAEALDVNRDRIRYACLKGRLLNGVVLSYDPLSPDAVKKAKQRRATNPTAPKAVVRSDGLLYRTMSEAAKDLGVSPSTITYALKHGSAVQGFKFTRAVPAQIERQVNHG